MSSCSLAGVNADKQVTNKARGYCQRYEALSVKGISVECLRVIGDALTIYLRLVG